VALLVVRGQLAQGGADDGDVVGGGVRAGVAAAQQHRHRLPGPGLAVIEERAQRVMPEAAFERRRGLLLLRVGGHQGGVDIDDQRSPVINPVIRGDDTGPGPHLPAGGGSGHLDRAHGPVGVVGQRGDQPRDRRVRGDPPEHLGCPAQHRNIGQTVTADRQ
jgi:hypothetical protein